MFHEYREVITKMKVDNAHFSKLFDKHNEIDDKIDAVEAGREHLEHFELETLKKEKLKLKDEVYQMILKYQKDHNL